MSTEIADESEIVNEIRIAAVAAEAARAVPGVHALQPGIWGLVQQFSKELWQRVTKESFPDIAGVDVERSGDQYNVEVTLVADVRRAINHTAIDVQRQVASAVKTKLDTELSSVSVHVCAIDIL